MLTFTLLFPWQLTGVVMPCYSLWMFSDCLPFDSLPSRQTIVATYQPWTGLALSSTGPLSHWSLLPQHQIGIIPTLPLPTEQSSSSAGQTEPSFLVRSPLFDFLMKQALCFHTWTRFSWAAIMLFSPGKKCQFMSWKLSWNYHLLAKTFKIHLSVPGMTVSFPQVPTAWCAAFALAHNGTKWNYLLASLPRCLSLC